MERAVVEVHRGEVPQKEGFIRFVCLSDTHNLASQFNIPPGDVLLHAGDFSRRGLLSEIVEFNDFLSLQPHKHKVVVAGNHDLSFDLLNQPALQSTFEVLRGASAAETKRALTNCTYLEDSVTMIEGYTIYGSPWTPTHCNMAFNLDRGPKIAEKWQQIPQETDILITHGPPFGLHDACFDGNRVGCQDLLLAVESVRPLVHLFGHVHEGYGFTAGLSTTFINASNCAIRYQPVNPPLVFDLPLRSKSY
jgi:Icc-related predicted phosphoesterase